MEDKCIEVMKWSTHWTVKIKRFRVPYPLTSKTERVRVASSQQYLDRILKEENPRRRYEVRYV